MKIQILSDLHLEFGDYYPDHADPDVIVMAGDVHLGAKGIGWMTKRWPDCPVLYVIGNHEYYGHALPRLADKIRKSAEGSNVEVLENRSVSIDGVEFFGCTLWTDFRLFHNQAVARYEADARMNDYRRIRLSPLYRRLRPADSVSAHSASRRWLEKAVRESSAAHGIVVTHHAPSNRSVPPRFRDDLLSAAYASNLDDLVEELSPDLWVHGHMHESCDYRIGRTRVLCNPRGYADCPNADFDPSLVVEI